MRGHELIVCRLDSLSPRMATPVHFGIRPSQFGAQTVEAELSAQGLSHPRREGHGQQRLGPPGSYAPVRVRICLVTPFAWSQPHDVNEHVAGVAGELRALGREVTVLAPSTRATDLLAGRRVVQGHAPPQDVVAVGPAIPVSRRSQMGVPVGVRASLRLALARGRFDLVHGFEPGLPSLSYLALRETDALTVATFCSTDRLGYPPARSQREKLLARTDALLAFSDEVREAAGERFPGDYELVSPGVSLELHAPAAKRNLIVVELRPNERPLAREVLRALRELPDWEAVLLRTTPLVGASGDPSRPRRAGRGADRARRCLAGGAPRSERDLRARDRGAAARPARGPRRRLRDRDPDRSRRAAGARRRRRGAARRRLRTQG